MSTDAPPLSKPGPLRWWVLGGIVALVIGLFVFINVSERVGETYRNASMMAATALTGLLLAFWFLVLSGATKRTKIVVSGAAAGLLILTVALVKVKGFEGDMKPQFAWRWGAKDYALPQFSEAKEAIPLASSARDYPQFLGPTRNGIITGVKLETDWSAKPPKEVWRQPIGAGWSAFVVVGEHAFTQEQRAESEVVSCYELKTGLAKWGYAVPKRFSESLGGDGPRATPCVAGGKVYALGATGVLSCIDGTTGRKIWSRDVLAESQSKNLQWGKAASPLLVDDLIVVSLGADGDATLAAYRIADGAPAWTAGTDRATYSSPTLATICGKRQILHVSANAVSGHNPADGTILWSQKFPGQEIKVSQPVAVDGDRVFISAGYGIGCALLQISENSGKFSAKELWHNLRMKTKFTNVVMRDGYVYGLDEGILECIALDTGELQWKEGRYGHGQVILVDDVLVVQAEAGDVALVAAKPSAYQELSRLSPLSAKTWNNPALAAPYLIVRNDQEAVCLELPLK